jgi:hypothetical protein
MKSYSIKRISESLNVERETARKIKALVNYELEPDQFESVDAWIRQCYNEPSIDEKIMCALNELLDGHGIEAIRDSRQWDSYYGDCRFSYVNMGDTYNATILYDCMNDRYILSSWGDVVERLNIV